MNADDKDALLERALQAMIQYDSALSLLRHRCQFIIPWDSAAAPSLQETDQLIGRSRSLYEEISRAIGRNLTA